VRGIVVLRSQTIFDIPFLATLKIKFLNP
jgi:hypothetical protein